MFLPQSPSKFIIYYATYHSSSCGCIVMSAQWLRCRSRFFLSFLPVINILGLLYQYVWRSPIYLNDILLICSQFNKENSIINYKILQNQHYRLAINSRILYSNKCWNPQHHFFLFIYYFFGKVCFLLFTQLNLDGVLFSYSFFFFSSWAIVLLKRAAY